MKTILGVSKGDYSEYCVLAIFTTRKKAQEYLTGLQRSDAEIEEFALDPDPPVYVAIVCVHMERNGDVLYADCGQADIADAGFVHYLGPGGRLVWNVATDNMERAVKVVNEKRAMLIAAEAFGDDEKTRRVLGIA